MADNTKAVSVTFPATLKWSEERQQWLLDNPVGYFDTKKVFLSPKEDVDNRYTIIVAKEEGFISERPKQEFKAILRRCKFLSKWMLLKDTLEYPPFMFDFGDRVEGFYDCLNTRKVFSKPSRKKPNAYMITIITRDV